MFALQYHTTSALSFQPTLYPLSFSNSLMTTRFASRNRSTHCLMHGSSYLSSLPFLTVPLGIHLRKQVSVREWTAVSTVSICCRVLQILISYPMIDSISILLGHIQDWIRAFCDSLVTNCWSSCLSRSLSRETSTFARPPPRESIATRCVVAKRYSWRCDCVICGRYCVCWRW
jgi:hypothetical protein